MTETAFLEALQAGDAQRARELLDDDPALAQARTPEGTSALMVALYARLEDIAEAIVEAGAEPDVFEAVVLGDVDHLRGLLDAAPEKVSAHAPDGFTPLHLAAHFGRLDVISVLLGRGADVDAKATNPMVNRPLHAAAAGCQAEAARVLLDEGAHVGAQDAGGNTPVHVAAANGHAPTVERLQAAGADPAVRNDEGLTPADLARERGFEALADRLAGASSKAPD